MSIIEKADNRFPVLGKKLIKLAREKKTSTVQDMLLCTAITLSSAFYEYETFMPAVAADVLRILIMVLLPVCWFWCAFLNGIWKKHSFMIFTAVYWIIPRIIIIWRQNMSITNYNRFLDAASQYSRLCVETSLRGLSSLLNITELTTSIVLMVWCLCFFYGGRVFRKSVK